MLETIITSTNGESFTLFNALLIISSAIILGLIISLAYIKTHKREGYAPSFTITLPILLFLNIIINLIIYNIKLRIIIL